MKKVIIIILYYLLILLGGFLFIYGEYDDSPGGQLLGVILAVIGVVQLVRIKKKITN